MTVEDPQEIRPSIGYGDRLADALRLSHEAIEKSIELRETSRKLKDRSQIQLIRRNLDHGG